jgi:hypothetical protein
MRRRGGMGLNYAAAAAAAAAVIIISRAKNFL